MKNLWCLFGLHRWALSDDAKTEFCLDCPKSGPVPEELRDFAKKAKAKEKKES